MGLPNKPMTNGTGGKLGDPAKGEVKPQASRSPEPPKPTESPEKPNPLPVSPKPPTPPPLPTPTPTSEGAQIMPLPPARPSERT
jgi:hypothetical protein